MANEKQHADSVRAYLTGASSDGGAQTDPDASLGNYRSSTLCEFLDSEITNAISNVTVDFISGANGEGAGTLTATGNDSLAWTPPGGSQGDAVTIANGETKILEGGSSSPEKYIRVSRTSADNLTGTATVTLSDVFNDVVGFDNVSSDESSAGDVEYRCLCLKNDASSEIKNLTVWLGTLGTQRVSASTQLGASGAGTIAISSGNFSDWPDSGFCRIQESDGTLREIVYYSSRTSTELTIPTAGRGLLGTSAGAGASDDTVDAVPGIRIAKEAPSAQSSGYFTDKTSAGEGSQPAGLSWATAITSSDANVIDIGDLSAGNIYGLWIERTVVAGAIAEADVLNLINWSFDAA
jgi:hypothetical protein